MSTNNKWSRGVSIIGAAYTPFGNVLETAAIKGMTYRELLSWAVLEALEKAGITTKEVDSLMVANYQAETIKTQCIHAVAAEWLGMQTKPSVKYETACASGASGLDSSPGIKLPSPSIKTNTSPSAAAVPAAQAKP